MTVTLPGNDIAVTVAVISPLGFEYEGEKYNQWERFTAHIDAGLRHASANNVISFIDPSNRQADTEVELVMYTGGDEDKPVPHDKVHIPAGKIMHRCVAFPTTPEHAKFLIEEDGPGWQTIDFKGGFPYYVGPTVTLDSFDELKSKMPDNPRFLFIRDNGIGDILMSLPTMRKIKELIPDAHITYATKPGQFDLLSVPYIDETVSIHNMRLNSDYHMIVNWALAVENYRPELPRNRDHRLDSFAAMLGLELDNKEIDFTVPSIPSLRPTIAYVMNSASWSRSLGVLQHLEIIALLQERLPGYYIMLIDPTRYEIAGEKIVNLTGKTKSFKEAAAMIRNCKLVVCPDSGLAHAAGALGLKTLVMMGDIPFDVRYRYYPDHHEVRADADLPCSPCWGWQEKNEDGTKRSCNATKQNLCMTNITAEMVVEKAVELLNG